MFTGIVTAIGTVAAIDKKGDWRITIKTGALPLADTKIGASISCSGVCLTVIAKTATSFDVQVSGETLAVTTLGDWKEGTHVNLEPALKFGDELGGHLVAGHIDSVARVTARMQDGDSLRLEFEIAPELARYLAQKGSVVVDGVSLTVNAVSGNRFGVNIIPHTQEATTLSDIHMGDSVNIEVDMMARYLDRLLQARQ